MPKEAKVASEIVGDQINIKQSGIGNTIVNNFEIKLGDNSPFNGKDKNDKLEELIGTLISETCNNEYRVFVCASDESLSCEKSEAIFSDLIKSLTENDIEFVVGGGKSIIDGDYPYPNIFEYDLCKKNEFDVIVIIADDYSTISQFSLLSHLKHSSELNSIEMYLIYKDDIINCDYIQKGLFDFFTERVKGCIIPFSDFDSNVLVKLCKEIERHKLFVSG